MPPRGVKKGVEACSPVRAHQGLARGPRRARAEEIAARTVNKERARHGESADVFAPLTRGHVVRAAWRRSRPSPVAARPHPRPALRGGKGPEHRGRSKMNKVSSRPLCAEARVSTADAVARIASLTIRVERVVQRLRVGGDLDTSKPSGRRRDALRSRVAVTGCPTGWRSSRFTARPTSTPRPSSAPRSRRRSTAARVARRRPQRGDVHRLDDTRGAPRRGQALRPAGRARERRLHRPPHPPDLRDHVARPGLHAVPGPRRRRSTTSGDVVIRLERGVHRSTPSSWSSRDGRVPRCGQAVLGGLSSRFELPVDRVEDLLLAVESVLSSQELAADVVTMEATRRRGPTRARRAVRTAPESRTRRSRACSTRWWTRGREQDGRMARSSSWSSRPRTAGVMDDGRDGIPAPARGSSSGRAGARDQIVEQYMPLVRKMASRYAGVASRSRISCRSAQSGSCSRSSASTSSGA